MRARLRQHAFTLWLLAAVLVAVFFPGPGSPGGFLMPELTPKLGVWAIFFLQGLSLPTRELLAGYKPKRLHLFTLTWNYLWFPILGGVFAYGAGLLPDPELKHGFWFLAILPTTVSSAITFATISGGSSANAIFATVFSNLLAVIAVPVLAVAYLTAGVSVEIPLAPLFGKLALLILFPLLLGQAARFGAPAVAARLSRHGKRISGGIILFIVHVSFAGSVSAGFLETLSWGALGAVLAGTSLLLAVVSLLVWWSAGRTGLTAERRKTAFFCASQKSLATGLPMITSIVAAAPGLVDPAAALIPLMCYHPMQLLLAGWLSGRWSGAGKGA